MPSDKQTSNCQQCSCIFVSLPCLCSKDRYILHVWSYALKYIDESLVAVEATTALLIIHLIIQMLPSDPSSVESITDLHTDDVSYWEREQKPDTFSGIQMLTSHLKKKSQGLGARHTFQFIGIYFPILCLTTGHGGGGWRVYRIHRVYQVCNYHHKIYDLNPLV